MIASGSYAGVPFTGRVLTRARDSEDASVLWVHVACDPPIIVNRVTRFYITLREREGIDIAWGSRINYEMEKTT